MISGVHYKESDLPPMGPQIMLRTQIFSPRKVGFRSTEICRGYALLHISNICIFSFRLYFTMATVVINSSSEDIAHLPRVVGGFAF